jgi:hypothetical protein
MIDIFRCSTINTVTFAGGHGAKYANLFLRHPPLISPQTFLHRIEQQSKTVSHIFCLRTDVSRTPDPTPFGGGIKGCWICLRLFHFQKKNKLTGWRFLFFNVMVFHSLCPRAIKTSFFWTTICSVLFLLRFFRIWKKIIEFDYICIPSLCNCFTKRAVYLFVRFS